MRLRARLASSDRMGERVVRTWLGSRSVTVGMDEPVSFDLRETVHILLMDFDLRLGGARVTEMPNNLSTLKSESRVINTDGCSVGTCAWKLMFRRVIFRSSVDENFLKKNRQRSHIYKENKGPRLFLKRISLEHRAIAKKFMSTRPRNGVEVQLILQQAPVHLIWERSNHRIRMVSYIIRSLGG